MAKLVLFIHFRQLVRLDLSCVFFVVFVACAAGVFVQSESSYGASFSGYFARSCNVDLEG